MNVRFLQLAAAFWLAITAGQVVGASTDEVFEDSTDSDYFSVGYEHSDSAAALDCNGQFDCNDDCTCDRRCDCDCDQCCCLRTVPNMLGDSLDVPLVFGFAAGDQIGIPRHYVKAADNNNVLPQSRISVGYNLYNNVPKRWTRPGGTVLEETEISEYKLVLERAIYDGDFSFHLVLPLYDTIKFTQSRFVGTTLIGDEGTQFGNLAFGFKKLVRRSERSALSVGLLTEAPTAQNYLLYGQTIVNDQWFFSPYLGWQYTPNDRWYAHGFASYRMRTGDNQYLGGAGANFIQSDRVLLDGGLGYWMFRNDFTGGAITGLSPTVELHYMTLTEDQSPLLYTAEWYNRVDMLNMTLGATAELRNGGTLATGVALPMRQGKFPGGNLPTDRSMDWELILQYNHLF